MPSPSQDPLFEQDFESFRALFAQRRFLFAKKLSVNDRKWANANTPFENDIPGRASKQNGPYVSASLRGSPFFPKSTEVPNRRGDGRVEESVFSVVWPQFGGQVKDARLRYYHSKRECHLTGVLKEAFVGLQPASLLLLFKDSSDASEYVGMTVCSTSPAYEMIAETLSLEPGFLAGMFDRHEIETSEEEKRLQFADELFAAWTNGRMAEMVAMHGRMPDPFALARSARSEFLSANGAERANPFVAPSPGDDLMKVTRVIEYGLFKEHERRAMVVKLVRTIFGESAEGASLRGIMRALAGRFGDMDKMMQSSMQSRRARAGLSFEIHIAAMLEAGGVPATMQRLLANRTRPDFILPSKRLLLSPVAGAPSALILSAKTTLKERWKQVLAEMEGRNAASQQELYLLTMDETVAQQAVDEMARRGIVLVVPEAIKASKYSEYRSTTSVISVKDLCETVIGPRLAGWIAFDPEGPEPRAS